MKKTEFDHALSTVGWVGMIGMTFWGAVMWGGYAAEGASELQYPG